MIVFLENRLIEGEMEWKNLRQLFKEMEGRVDYGQFERLCEELQRALDREKQAQDLLNEQNQQLKSLTDILQQTQEDKDFLQDKLLQSSQDEKNKEEKIQQLTRSHQQMDENVKRAEKAIRFVVNDKQQISTFCKRIQSIVNLNDKSTMEINLPEVIRQLETLVELPKNNKSPPELILCQVGLFGLKRKNVFFFSSFRRCLEDSFNC